MFWLLSIKKQRKLACFKLINLKLNKTLKSALATSETTLVFGSSLFFHEFCRLGLAVFRFSRPPPYESYVERESSRAAYLFHP